MAFQTNVLRNGAWVTETVNVQEALKVPSTSKAFTRTQPTTPLCGILSRTIVESPIVHWILPTRLRSENHNDIAFIGDNFVQISELRNDGQVHEVARKSDFKSRIRGAVVLGDSLQHGLDDDDPAEFVKIEDHDTLPRGPLKESNDTRPPGSLPPQFLVLMLEGGDIVFTFLRQTSDSTFDFVLKIHPGPSNISYLGCHLSADPSSRYVAAASPDGVLVLYEIQSMLDINKRFHKERFFDPVKSICARPIRGVIHTLEFLYPRPGDSDHMILLLIVTRKEISSTEPASRLFTYEWKVGESLRDIFAEEKIGHRLPKEHRMPSLIIPLRFNTAFFTVSQPDIGIVKDCLSGSPVFEVLDTDTPGATPLHHGLGSPLWTAWSRPFRRRKYFEKTDIIYLAREDGAVVHVEIDVPELVPSVTNVGCLDTNINTAFTTAYDVFTDVLIICGDSGPGGVWKLAPRTDLEQVSVLPNWSPVIDIATVSWRSMKRTTLEKRGTSSKLPEADKSPCKPDSLFTASGRGLKGNLTQWRWGIQGRIGLDVESGESVRRSWVFSFDRLDGGNLYGLLALPDASIALRFAKDFSRVDSVDADDTGFDLASRTLQAYQRQSGLVMQVTETSISFVTISQTRRFALETVLGRTGVIADLACCVGDVLVLATHQDTIPQLHTLRIEGTDVSLHRSWDITGEITCVSLLNMSGNCFVLGGSVAKGASYMSVFSLDGELAFSQAIRGPSASQSIHGMSSEMYQFEALTSICTIREGDHDAVFVVGTRCGHALTFRLLGCDPGSLTWNSEVMGVAPVEVFPTNGLFDGHFAVLACCDNNLVMMSRFSEANLRFESKVTIWLTDSNDMSMPSAPIHSVFSLGLSLSGYAGHMSLMLLAESRLLFADIWPSCNLVPRCLPLGGTPTRIFFSKTWNCLVVALLQDNRPTLSFIDPLSGEQMAVVVNNHEPTSNFISGLGHQGDRIYGLSEWLIVKASKTFAFLLVTTKEGRLLVVSVKRLDSRKGEAGSVKLQYCTKFKKFFGKPIYAVVGDNDHIIFCVDKTIHWNAFDVSDKKLRSTRTYELDSPATSLRVSHGKLYALTTMHSLEVLDQKAEENDGNVLIQSDRFSRTSVHMIDIGAGMRGLEDGRSSLTLLSDQRGGLAGVWAPCDQESGDLETIFEGSLTHSVRRFTQARSRPPWLFHESRTRYGLIASNKGESETVGVSLDGSLRHFALIDLELWRLLKLLENLTQCPLNLKSLGGFPSDSRGMEADDEADIKPQVHPKRMQVNGDLLRMCLEDRLLETMVEKRDCLHLFCGYLDGLEGGRWTDAFRSSSDLSKTTRSAAYFTLGYEILEYLLAPVL